MAANSSLHNAASGIYQVNTTPDLTTGSGQITINDSVTAGTINLQSSEGDMLRIPAVSFRVHLALWRLTRSAFTTSYLPMLLSLVLMSVPAVVAGSIGAFGQNVLTTAANLTVVTGGNVFVTNTGSVISWHFICR